MFLFFFEGSSFVSPTIDKLINLIIYVGILVFLLRKPALKFFANRAKEIQDQINKAEREKKEALEKLQAVEMRLNKLDGEIDAIKANAVKEAQAEYERIMISAKADSVRLTEMAQREIQGLTKTARLELKAFAAEQAVDLAEQMIKREMQATDANRLVSDYISELEKTA